MQKSNRKDDIVREAIWKCYERKCFDCGRSLQKIDMTVDHVIPQSCRKDEAKWKKTLSDFNLNSGFELDSLENYTCACGRCNRQKSDKIFPRQTEKALHRAASLAPKIRKEIKKIRREIDFSKDRSKVKSHIRGDRSKADNLYNYITDEDGNFTEERHISYCAGTAFYHYAKQNIMLNAYLPTYADEGRGSCLLAFKTLRMRDCAITLGHEEILKTLCRGARTLLSQDLRNFVVCRDYHDSNIYYIQIGNVRFPLEAEQLNILIEIIDDFADVYCKHMIEIENRLGTYEFQPSGRRNGFKLLKVKRWIWQDIIRFARIFDYEAGHSKWHIFDSPANILNVYTSHSTDALNAGHHVTLYSESTDGSYFDYGDEVWITWYPSRQLNNSDQDFPDFNFRNEWNAYSTYTWLTEELMPYIEFYFSLREQGYIYLLKRILIKFLNIEHFFYNKFLCEFRLDNSGVYDGTVKYRYIDTAQISISKDLLQVAHKLQQFFYMRSRDIFDQKNYKSLLGSLLECIEHSSRNDWSYMREKLSFIHSDSREEIIKDIDNFLKSIAQGENYSYLLDDIFRVYIAALEESKLNSDEVQKVVNSWLPFIGLYQDDLFIRKHTQDLY